MKLVIGLAILAISQARHTIQKCDDVIVDNVPHMKKILLDNKDSPYQLTIDYKTNTLFFSYTSTNGEKFTSAHINLKTNEYATIPGINAGFASTVDNERHIVYLGGEDGLYKFNYETKTATHIEGTNQTIWQMFFKNNIYYTTYPKEKVYTFNNGKSEIVPELANTNAMLIALNNDLDYYFTNYSGLFKYQKSNGDTLLLGDYVANAMTADNEGNLYFSTPNGIYFIDEKDNIKEIALIPDIYGVAIENDGNIIYATIDAIVRLEPAKSSCFVDENKMKD